MVSMEIETEQQRIAGFVEKGNFHAAINLAISAMNACRREHDQAGVDHFLTVIDDIVARMRERYGSRG